jgi:ribosome-binding protein aMBF1 (putative translation factor)
MTKAMRHAEEARRLREATEAALREQVGGSIRKLRMKNGLTLRELAFKVDSSESRLSRIELGQDPINYRCLSSSLTFSK